MPGKLYQRIYLSPHLDDAALSCGGLIYQESQAGLGVLVVTLMAGDAPPEAKDSPTPILADLHARWKLEAHPNPVAVRRAEDREAMSILNSDFGHWEWPECVYRRHPKNGAFLYPSEASLWEAVHPLEKPLSATLTRRLAELPLAPGGRVFAPLAVGGHVDHRLVRQAAESWGRPDGELVYYEEYPYAERPESLASVVEDRRRWRPESVLLREEALVAKTDAVARYDSQISTFFTGKEEIGPRLRAYATKAGEGEGMAERYWRRDSG